MRSPVISRFTISRLVLAIAAAGAVAGCHSTGPSAVASVAPPPAPTPSGYATQPYTPQGFKLPEGSGCSGDIARWQAIQDNDYKSGNVNLTVYNQIKGEIASASAACAAGRDGEARQMISASRARHGYPG